MQGALLEVLEAIYEQDFESCWYGFRPGRSAHDALRDLNHPVWSEGVLAGVRRGRPLLREGRELLQCEPLKTRWMSAWASGLHGGHRRLLSWRLYSRGRRLDSQRRHPDVHATRLFASGVPLGTSPRLSPRVGGHANKCARSARLFANLPVTFARRPSEQGEHPDVRVERPDICVGRPVLFGGLPSFLRRRPCAFVGHPWLVVEGALRMRRASVPMCRASVRTRRASVRS